MSGSTSQQGPIEPAVPRHGRMPRHGAWRTFGKVAASVVAVLAVSATAIVAYAAVDLLATATDQPPVKLESERVLENVPDIGAMEGGLNFLLVGSDKRPEDGAFGDPEEESAVLNDVTMLLHISQDHTHVEVVSFPRDMLVDVPECVNPDDPEGERLSALSGTRMNEVLSWGGFGCVASTIEQLTGVTIPVGGIVEFYGVAALSTAVGGVDVCVVDRIEDPYTGLFLDPGTHSLSGMDALAFLRTRHGVGDGSDLARISNQQVFLSSLARTLQSNGTLADPVKLYSIAKAALANMQLSDSLMDPTRMISIAKALKDTDLNKIAFIQYPTAYVEGGAVAPTDSAQYVRTALQNDLPVTFDPAAQADSEFGTVADPNATPPAEAPAEEAPAETAPAETAPAPTAEALPADVTGQTAAETRCSAGRTLDDQ